MKKQYYQKLIRDRIPEIIEKSGGVYETVVLPEKDFEQALKDKLFEESREVASASEETLLEELADVLEVLKTLATLHHIPFKKIIDAQRKKRRLRGGFRKKLQLIWASKKNP